MIHFSFKNDLVSFKSAFLASCLFFSCTENSNELLLELDQSSIELTPNELGANSGKLAWGELNRGSLAWNQKGAIGPESSLRGPSDLSGESGTCEVKLKKTWEKFRWLVAKVPPNSRTWLANRIPFLQPSSKVCSDESLRKLVDTNNLEILFRSIF